MKFYSLISFLILLISCGEEKTASQQKIEQLNQEIIESAFQSILDSAKVEGAILIYDLKENTFKKMMIIK